MKKKAKLILGGGSAYGLAHIGVLAALEEEFEITGIIGTSMGAIVGATYAYGYKPLESLDLALNIRPTELYNPLHLDLARRGIFDGKVILKTFRDWTNNRKIERGNIPFVAVAYDLVQKRSILIDKGSFADAMRASSSLPYIFAPHSWGKYLFVDGGVEHPLPVAFRDMVPGEICIAVNVLPPASTHTERIELSRADAKAKLNLHQVFLQSLLQNQAFIAIQEMLEHKPDIYIDAHCASYSLMDMMKAREFYNYGKAVAEKALQQQDDLSIMDALRNRYQKIISRIKSPLNAFLGD
ncbi:MAG TPA: patatin-like phospholipase family protein [Candidatus Cloacimonadota bacterium]|nr:patatin-like phospholipase family protein [Candidatus Cloacimonadota bacterium]